MQRPGDPEYTVNGDTTVSEGSTVLSAIIQQSFKIHLRPFIKSEIRMYQSSDADSSAEDLL